MQLHSNIIGEGKPFVILHGFLGMGDNIGMQLHYFNFFKYCPITFSNPK